MTSYIAYYPLADTGYILTADPKRYPRRDDPYQAAEDARKHWNWEGQHLILYRVNDDETVTQIEARVKRLVVVKEASDE